MDALSNLLSEALNKARGNDGGGRETILRLAARLIEQHDEDRRSRGKRYTDPKAIWDSIEAGDVILIRASWLLERAGFVEVGRDGGLCSDSNWCWCSRSEPKPLPRRQDIERDHPEAILPLAELREMHRAFQRVAKESTSTASGSGVAGEEPSAFDEGAEALPIVTCSHCWESIDHPDPEGRTLRILAAELADGAWDAFDQRGFPIGTPTAGLPLYRLWGFEDGGGGGNAEGGEGVGARHNRRLVDRHRAARDDRRTEGGGGRPPHLHQQKGQGGMNGYPSTSSSST